MILYARTWHAHVCIAYIHDSPRTPYTHIVPLENSPALLGAKVMATSCLAVPWRTLGHVARGLVAADGTPRTGRCSGVHVSSAGTELVDGAYYNTLPCDAPCELYREWGGGLICGQHLTSANGTVRRLNARCAPHA